MRVEGGVTYAQTFDAENRLISVTISGQSTTFVYDGDGNLVKKLKPDGTITVYIGGVYEVELNGTTVTKTTLYYPAAGAVRVIQGGNNNLYYVLKDHLGSASVTLDASGNVVANGEQRYYPFGESRLTGAALPTDRLYTGQRDVGLGGLYHYNARFYLPKLGRFISADTIVPEPSNPQALNRYSYVRNNPVKYIDPSGHCWGIASGLRSLPTYDVTCNNLDMALTIVQHPEASIEAKAGAVAYIAVEGGAHLALVAGSSVLVWEGGVAVAGSVKAATTAGTLTTAACADGDCTNEANAGVQTAFPCN